jgi:type IV pilus assembly protein PilV
MMRAGRLSFRGSLPRLAGFSLLEVLVAVLVLGIGLTAVASIQMTSKRANFEAVQRATAAVLTQDIIERMRVNPGELAVYTNGGLGLTLSGTTMAAQSCSGGCTPAQLASHDLYEWEQALSGVTEQEGGQNTGGITLPTACIFGPNGGSGVYTVAIAWRGLNKLSNPTAHTCGEASGLYDGDTAGDNVFRRLIVVNTFIAEPF